jgi:Na+:H+ antiporter, NhaA family
MSTETTVEHTRLLVPINRQSDHIRGDGPEGSAEIVLYGDYLCPYCRRLRTVLLRLLEIMPGRLIYVFRHFPNETVHPGATFAARASEAASAQGQFWEMHDQLYEHEPPLSEAEIRGFAATLALDLARFERDLARPETTARVEQDLGEGRRNGVSATPAIFINGTRYDGAWDLFSMIEILEEPLGVRVGQSARAFANLPASGGLVLLLAAAVALICANSGLAPYYHLLIGSPFDVGPPGHRLSLTVGGWLSEGLLAIFFVLVGLGVRREITDGSLTTFRAAVLPAIAALGGVVAPALLYLAVNHGASSAGWSVPTATDIAFTLGILALFGPRVPQSLKVFVAALAVVDDVLSVLTLAIFYPKSFSLEWVAASAVVILALVALNRGRVYATWPYVVLGIVLWICLHSGGVHGALAGVFLAACLPDRPRPAVAPLLAQAATALATLDAAERTHRHTTPGPAPDRAWEWASRNLRAASDRLLSPADRVENAIEPWSNYFILPLFAFSATGISLSFDFSAPDSVRVLIGVVLGLVIGKPLGVLVSTRLATLSGIGVGPANVPALQFVGVAFLCGIGDTIALLMADQAFPDAADSGIAKTGVLVGSLLAAAIGAGFIALGSRRPQPR